MVRSVPFFRTLRKPSSFLACLALSTGQLISTFEEGAAVACDNFLFCIFSNFAPHPDRSLTFAQFSPFSLLSRLPLLLTIPRP